MVFSPTVHACACGLLKIHVIIAPKWGVPNGNHMDDDIAEVNTSAAPGSFFNEKGPVQVAISLPKGFITT